jgi:hypothetical protein
MKRVVILAVGSLAILLAPARAWAYCEATRLVQVGRLPDVILPAGRAVCVNLPPALLKVKAIAAAGGNCGLCVRVRSGSPHVGVLNDARTAQNCVPGTPFTPRELLNATINVETVRHNNLGFAIYSDGTPGSGTIEITTRADGEGSTCDPASSPAPYAIGTFNYFVTSAAVTDNAFTHVVSVANNPVPSRTVLTHPLLDGQGGVRPIVMSVWNHGSNPGVDNNHPVGLAFGIDVWDRWSIVALDGGALPMGAQFNVEVAPHSDSEEFAAPPVPAYRRAMTISSFMNHNAQALLFPVGGGNLANGPSSVGSYFSTGSNSWVLSNMNAGQIPDYANFFVRFIGAPGTFLSSLAQRVQADSSNTFWETVVLGNPLGLNALSRIFVSPIWAPGTGPGPFPPDGAQVSTPLGVWWTGSQWALWRQDWQAVPEGAKFNAYWHRPAIVADPTPGDSTADRLADITLVGGNLSTLPMAASASNGYFAAPTSGTDGNFVSWAQVGKPISGDFDADGRNDVALTGVSGWGTIPVAFSMGDGTYLVTNGGVSLNDNSGGVHVPQTLPLFAFGGDANFPSYAGQAGANPVGGDFNGDGLQDIALLTVPGESLIPIAFSRGEGTFMGTKRGVETGDTNFTTYAGQGAKVVVGDFDGDKRSDIALTGGSGWTTVPVAFSKGNGSFHGTNLPVATFPGLADEPGAVAIAGDFDGDGKSDIAIAGASTSCADVVIAFSNGDGTFDVSSSGCYVFWGFAGRWFSGDFNGDRKTDLGFVTSFTDSFGATWHDLTVGLSNGDATFNVVTTEVTAAEASDFVAVAATSGGAVLSGSPGSPYLRNLALGKSASQSPTEWGGDPGRAVDGNPSGNWTDNSVTHTQTLSQPWWQVDLGAVKSVRSIDIFNRTDCCADRLTNYNVMTSTNGSTWSTINHATQAGNPSSLAVNAQARYVKVQLVGTNPLSLAEVYVWGW